MSVLLIEPDALLGDVYGTALERAGHTVAWARGGQQAVMLADSTTPDVVVLELQLPGHGGVEFLYEFRSYQEWQKVPIIFHTLAFDQHLTITPELGVVAYLYKPATNLQQLIRTVNEAALVQA